jgi:timeless
MTLDAATGPSAAAEAPESSSAARSGGKSNNNNNTRNRRPNPKNVITPPTVVRTSLDRRMAVDKNVVDELLLVCGVIGTTTENGNEIVPVTDCLNWLQDLQRALRRDDDGYRPISLLLGRWKVVEQKLIPLVMTCRYDTSIVLTVLKTLVILTKPISDATKNAGRMVVDVKNKGNRDAVPYQIKLRNNALQQSEQLMEYKRLVTYHPSHKRASSGSSKHQQLPFPPPKSNHDDGIRKSNNNNTKSSGLGGRKTTTTGNTGLLSVFVSLLAEPLSKSGASRTDADHLTIELVLHLIRNLLTAEPLLNSK